MIATCPLLHSFLTGILDYAGLFPPASLSLGQALLRFDHDRRGPDAWMLGAFVCPTSRFSELVPARPLYDRAGAGPLPVAALGRSAYDPAAFDQALRADISAIENARGWLSPTVIIHALETRPPVEAGSAWDGLVASAAQAARDAGLRLALELPLDDDLPIRLPALARHRVVAKFRTGGVTAAAIPAPATLAAALLAARDHRVPVKCTAGLHHPLRAHQPAVDAPMHGFLNVFLGLAFAWTHDWDAGTLESFLEVGDAAELTFDDDSVAWRTWRLDVAAVARARTVAALSFGSCSFDEPREDLRALNLLPPAS